MAPNVTYRPLRADEFAALAALDARNFGHPADGDELLAAQQNWLDLDHSVVAVDRDRPVAFGGTAPFELTLPGLSTIPLLGATWVSVNPSHTRLGVLRRIMATIDRFAVDLGIPVLGLQASNGGIYERFGYGVSTFARIVDLDRRATTIDARYQPDRSRVTLYDRAERRKRAEREAELFDRYRRGRAGERSMSAAYQAMTLAGDGAGEIYAEHPDGYALYTIETDWNEGHPAHRLQLQRLVAATEEAHLDLWATVMASDLVGPIRARFVVGPDDHLPYLLANPRALRTVERNDFTWLKVIDPVAAFSTRHYRSDDTLVVEVVEDLADPEAPAERPRTRFTVSGDGAETTDRPADMVAQRSALGPLLLGSVPTSVLVAGRRVRADPDVAARADVFFGHRPTAHSQLPM